MKKLLRMLMPWQHCNEDAAEPVKVEEMLLLVDIMLENISADAQQVDSLITVILLSLSVVPLCSPEA